MGVTLFYRKKHQPLCFSDGSEMKGNPRIKDRRIDIKVTVTYKDGVVKTELECQTEVTCTCRRYLPTVKKSSSLWLEFVKSRDKLLPLAEFSDIVINHKKQDVVIPFIRKMDAIIQQGKNHSERTKGELLRCTKSQLSKILEREQVLCDLKLEFAAQLNHPALSAFV
jgi:hypothetical protein